MSSIPKLGTPHGGNEAEDAVGLETDGGILVGDTGLTATVSSSENAWISVIMGGSVPDARRQGQEWAKLCETDPRKAMLGALSLIFELAGLPGCLGASDLDADPEAFLAKLPDWIREHCLDVSVYPLLPSAKQGRRSVMSFERFWMVGLGAQNAIALLESQLVALLIRWLLVMHNVPVRSIRHSSTVAGLAVAEALGYHHQTLTKTQETLQKQLEAVGRRNSRREAQLKRDLASLVSHTNEMYRVRTQLLETIVPSRSRDVSVVIRLYTLGAVERSMEKDPDMYLQNKWVARVFLMIHDPSVDVRVKALSVMHQWYATSTKQSEDVQEHLQRFAQKALSHVVERVGDVDPRVATAALKCLRLPALADRLEDEEFDTIVNLCIGARDAAVREEAALFVNSHVFQDPGICVGTSAPLRRGGARCDDSTTVPESERDKELGDVPELELRGADVVRELYNSETSLSMLVEYLDNYVGENLRIAERVVGAFWGRAPALTHWGTMVNLCLVGEAEPGSGLNAISPRQRLALLYIMEAALRKVEAELHNRPADKEAAVVKLNDACAHIIPELPRLLEICRPEEQQSLLLSHVSKILIEYAVANSYNQVLVNTRALCQALRDAIKGQVPLDAARHCTDALLALARCFREAKDTFLDLAKSVHNSCAEILAHQSLSSRADELRLMLGRFLVLSNRGTDLTFGNVSMLNDMMTVLRSRSNCMQQWRLADTIVTRTTEASQPQPPPPARPPEVPDSCMTLQLLEAVIVSQMWYVRMAFWVESRNMEDSSSAEVKQVVEMLQGVGELAVVRQELPRAVDSLRHICMSLISNDTNFYVQFHAYSAYMCIMQLAVGVSEKLSLEVEGGCTRSGPHTHYDINMPQQHMKTLWQYLNSLYLQLSEVDSSGKLFDAEGYHVAAADVYPALSQGTATSARFLTQHFMETTKAAGAVSEDDPSNISELSFGHQLLLAVLASRMVLESQLEDIYAGPLGLLLLTQCEKSRPRPLRELALHLLRRLRELARDSEECAVQYFHMQAMAIVGMFDSAGNGAAQALSSLFVRQWGPRLLPWLEGPFLQVLKQVVVRCVTASRQHLPLLEAFLSWVRHDFMQEPRAREIAEAVLNKCSSIGIKGAEEPIIAKFVQRVCATAALHTASAESTKRHQGAQPAEGQEMPAQGSPVPFVTHRITGKRSIEGAMPEPSQVSLFDEAPAQKLAKTDHADELSPPG